MIFEYFAQISSQDITDPFSTEPVTLQLFDGHGGVPDEIIGRLHYFVFPVDKVAAKMFTFCLTVGDGSKIYGFVKHRVVTSAVNEAFCLLSRHAFFSLFRDMLESIHVIAGKPTGHPVNNAVMEYLNTVYQKPEPFPGEQYTINVESMGRSFLLMRPPEDEDGVLGDVDYTVLTTHFKSPTSLLHVFASLLSERRIVLLSSDFAALSSCAHSLESIIYPFIWQHIFCPCLPRQLLRMVEAPMPYIMGVPSQLSGAIDSAGDVVVVDLDRCEVDLPMFDGKSDASRLPNGPTSALEKDLKRCWNGSGVDIAASFRAFFIVLFGGYDRFIAHDISGEWGFKLEQFHGSFEKDNVRDFVVNFTTQTQLWERFIEERLMDASCGGGSGRLFERDIAQDPSIAGTAGSTRWRIRPPRVPNKAKVFLSGVVKRGISPFTRTDVVQPPPSKTGRESFEDLHTRFSPHVAGLQPDPTMSDLIQ